MAPSITDLEKGQRMSSFKVELRLVKRDASDDSLQSALARVVDVSATEKMKHFKLKALKSLGVCNPRPNDLEHYMFICGSTKSIRNADNDKTCTEVGLSDNVVVRVLPRFP
jgi:hypothetical protein